MKKIPIFQQKGKLPEGKYTIGQIISPELQAEYQQYISQPWFKVHKPPTFDEWKLQRQRQQERQSVVKSNTRSRYQREQDQKRALAERERRQMKKAQQEAATVAGEVLNRTMPSTIARAAYDAATGDKSFVGSMIEGNKGLGHPVANLAFDLTSPFILNKGFQLGTKGFKYAWETLPKYHIEWENLPKDRLYSSPISKYPKLVSTTSSSQLLYNLKTGKIGLKELTDMVGQQQAKWVMKEKDLLLAGRGNQNKLNEILEKAALGTKGKRGSNVAIDQATKAELMTTPEGRLQLLQEKYLPKIEESRKRTGINWSDMDNQGMMATMDTDFKLSPVGFDSKTPFIERYYKNVLEITKPGGFQDKLLKSGDLRINPKTKQWEGKYPDGEYYPVRRPEEYVKVRYGRDVKKADIELPIPDGIYHNYPMHGTMTKDIGYLQHPSINPGKNGYWTVVYDKLGAESTAMGYYKGNGYSVPFFRSPSIETPAFNNGTSYNLMDMIHKQYSGKVMRPTLVKDANAPRGMINEYNFGPTAPNPKSSWNTLDFESGAGPFAYTPTKITVEGNDFT